MDLNHTHPSSAYSPNAAIAVFPGSFDPFTVGHLDLVDRGARLFRHLAVAVLSNSAKQPWLPLEERLTMVQESVRDYPNVTVISFSGLLVEFCRQQQAGVVLRGIRSVTDFEFEQPMASANRKLLPGLDIVFLMAAPEHAFISSRLVREVQAFGGDITPFVPEAVARQTERYLKP